VRAGTTHFTGERADGVTTHLLYACKLDLACDIMLALVPATNVKPLPSAAAVLPEP
jgi:hypothetical protein